MGDERKSYVVWMDSGFNPPEMCEELRDALAIFSKWVVNGFDNVTLSRQFADGTYIHVAHYVEKGGVL